MIKFNQLFILLMPLIFLLCSAPRHTTNINTTSDPQETVEKKTPIPLDGKVIYGKLDNGIAYYIRKNMKPENRAELRLVVNAGSILENDNQQGLAHFLEHMAFNGTVHFNKQELVDYLESIGMRFGPELNAYTGFDETVYMLQIPTDTAEIIEKAFLILKDWACGLSLEEEEIDKERGVIKEEWRLGRGAGARIRDKQFPFIFKNSKYGKRLPIGKIEVIDTFEYEVLKAFYQTWYRPDLMGIIAVGDFDPDSIKGVIVKKFSSVPASEIKTFRKEFPVPDHDETLFAIATDPEATGTQVSVYYKQDVESNRYEEDFRNYLVYNIYNNLLNKRFLELVKLAEPPFLNAFSYKGQLVRTKDVYVLGARVKENGILKGLETVLTEAERVKRFGFTQSELDRRKKEMMSYIERAYNERDKTVSGRYTDEYVSHYLENEPSPGIEYEFEMYKKYLPGINLEDINRLAHKFITGKNRVITISAPEKAEVQIPEKEKLLDLFGMVMKKELDPYVDKMRDEPLIKSMPEPGEIVSKEYIRELDVHRWTLSNGIKVILKSTDFKNDQILFSGYSPGGASLVPDSAYISALTAASIISQSGWGEFNKTELQKHLAGKIVRVSPWIGDLDEGLSGSTTPNDVETLFKLIYLNFYGPRRDSTVFQSYQNRMKGYLENRKFSPEGAYSDTIQVTVSQYHYRTRPWTLEILDEMDLDQSFRVYVDRFADASDFTFLFVGKIDLTQFESLLKQYVATLPNLKRNEKWKDVGIRYPTQKIKKTVMRGMEEKSRVRLIFNGDFQWNLKNRFALQVLERVMSIKLREKLREDKGGTYGVGVFANPQRYPIGNYDYTISFGCDPDRIDELLDVVFTQIDSMKQSNVEEKYIAKVKEALIRSHETSLEDNGYWLGILEFYIKNDLDPKHLLTFKDRVSKINADWIRETARLYLDTDRYVQVILKPVDN